MSENMSDMRKDGITRRGFIAGTSATMAGLAMSGWACAAEPDTKLILGSGTHRYECVHDWLKPTPDLLWGDTQGVAQDAHGNIYISHTVRPDSLSKDAIAVFDKNGVFLKSWGSRFNGGGHGLDLRKEGNQEYLYHCDTNHKVVVKTDLDGKVIWEKGVPVEAGVYPKENPNFIPTNVAFSPNGDFYVTDGYGSDWIHQYSIKGEWIRTFAGKGTDPGKVSNAHGIWVDTRLSDPLLAVADRANHRIQYLTLDGKHVRFVTDGMRLPCHFHIREDMLLVPDLSSVVTILDKNNKVIVQLGDGASLSELRGHPRKDYVPGKFIHPHSAKFLHNGDILVVEWVPDGRITLLKKLRA